MSYMKSVYTICDDIFYYCCLVSNLYIRVVTFFEYEHSQTTITA